MSGDGIFSKIARQPAVVRLWSNRALHLFAADTPGDGAPADLDIRVNDMNHVRRFEQTVPWQTHEDFVSAAERRIAEARTLLFTVAAADGPLLGYSLAHPNAEDTTYTHVDQRVFWPERTATLYGGYVHPMARGQGLHTALQQARIHHLITNLGMRWVVSGVVSTNLAALASARKSGLRPVARLRTRRRLGMARMSAERIDPAFDARFVDAA